jgi:hypothetical protein
MPVPGREAEAADEASGEVAYDITVEVGHDQDIECGGIFGQLRDTPCDKTWARKVRRKSLLVCLTFKHVLSSSCSSKTMSG